MPRRQNWIITVSPEFSLSRLSLFLDFAVPIFSPVVRDIAERGRTVEGVIDQYINTVKPAHERYIQPVRTNTGA